MNLLVKFYNVAGLIVITGLFLSIAYQFYILASTSCQEDVPMV